MDTIENQHLGPYNEVSLTQGLLVGVVLHNWAVEHNIAAFSELTFAVR